MPTGGRSKPSLPSPRSPGTRRDLQTQVDDINRRLGSYVVESHYFDGDTRLLGRVQRQNIEADFTIEPTSPFIELVTPSDVTSSSTAALRQGTIGQTIIIENLGPGIVTIQHGAMTHLFGAQTKVLDVHDTIALRWDGNLWVQYAGTVTDGGGTGGGGVVDASYITLGSNPNLLNERVLSVSGGLGLIDHGPNGALELFINNGAVTDERLENRAALSVMGRPPNVPGPVSDIVASSNGQVLRRAGDTLAFGAINLGDPNSVNGVLPPGAGGVPLGGLLNQVLTWVNGTYGWAAPQGGTGGGGVQDVLWTGASAPTDPTIELWADTDEECQPVMGPPGGLTGQVLTKASGADNDAIWAFPPAAPHELPAGGATGQILAKSSGADYAVVWIPLPQELPTGGTPGQVLTKDSSGGVVWAAVSGGLPGILPNNVCLQGYRNDHATPQDLIGVDVFNNVIIARGLGSANMQIPQGRWFGSYRNDGNIQHLVSTDLSNGVYFASVTPGDVHFASYTQGFIDIGENQTGGELRIGLGSQSIVRSYIDMYIAHQNLESKLQVGMNLVNGRHHIEIQTSSGYLPYQIFHRANQKIWWMGHHSNNSFIFAPDDINNEGLWYLAIGTDGRVSTRLNFAAGTTITAGSTITSGGNIYMPVSASIIGGGVQLLQRTSDGYNDVGNWSSTIRLTGPVQILWGPLDIAADRDNHAGWQTFLHSSSSTGYLYFSRNANCYFNDQAGITDFQRQTYFRSTMQANNDVIFQAANGLWISYVRSSPAEILYAYNANCRFNESAGTTTFMRGITMANNTWLTAGGANLLTYNGSMYIAYNVDLVVNAAAGVAHFQQSTYHHNAIFTQNGVFHLGNNGYYNWPDYVFEHAYTGQIEKFKDAPGAQYYEGLPTLGVVEDFTIANWRLPNHTRRNEVFTRSDEMLAEIERIYLYLFSINRQLQELRHAGS